MSMTEYDFGFAIVRVHDGKLTEEQRKVVIENAAKDFYKAIQRAEAQKKRNVVCHQHV